MAAHDVAGDREAEAHPAAVARARLAEPCEALEDALTGLAGDARSVVLDRERQLARAVVLGKRDRDAALGVADGVFEEVAHGARQLVAIAVELRPGDEAAVDRRAA